MNQKCFRNTVIVRLSLISLAAIFYLSASLTVKAVNLVQEFYLPMPEQQIYQANSAIISGTGSTIASTFSIVVTAGGTVIYYDQWEDGYETDLSNPVQPSTQIWGDGNTNNGVAPGYPNDILPAGAVITLTNSVSLPRNPSTLLWDARDRIAASKALVVSRAAWPVNPGPVFAGAAGVLSTLDYGTNYVSPVGQDMTNGLMKYVGMFVMAAQNNTALTIDPNGNGVGTTNVVLNQGESYLVNGGIKKGGRVTASKPVQADLLIGHVGASYASDWFTLYPVEEWSSTYFTSVGTAASGNPAYVYLFNPNSNALVINYSTQSGAGSFSVPGTNGVFQFPMPVGSGGSFASAGGQNFFAISTVAANPAADTAYNWGFTLVPEAALTTEAVVGWGPGSADGTVDGSPVWVTSLAATRLYVDYKGDHLGPLTDPNGNHYDTNYDLTTLQSKKIYDPNKNQTGMRIYTVDGTLITAAWGEDPDVAAPGNPYIDAGTTVLPFPVPVLKKTAAIVNDVAPTNLSIGDTIAYTVEIDNKGLLPLGNTVIIDAPSTNLLYVTNSTTYNGSPVPDSVAGTAFPLDESGFIIPVILSRGTSTFTYLCKVTASGIVSNSVNIGGSSIFSATSLAPAPASGAACNLNFTDAGGVQTGFYTAGGNIFVTMTNAAANTATNSVQAITVSVQNMTHGDVENIVLTETGTNTGVFRNTNGLPTSTSAGLGQQNGLLNVAAGDVLAVAYVDPNYGDTCTANAMILVPALTKQLYLSVNGSTNGVQALNRVDPVAYAHSPTRTAVDLGSGGGGITLDSVTTVSNTASLTATFSHTTSSGANRLMLVGVSINRLTGGTTFETPTNVTYAGVPLVLVGGRTNAVSQEGVMWMFALVNPPAGTANVVVNWNQAQTDGDVIGCATFTGVNQTTPYGPFFSSTNTSTAVSLVVPSAPGELVFDTVILRSSNFGASGSPGANQTALWKTYFNARVGAGASTQPGAATVTNTWTAAAAVDCAIGGVSIKPASVGGSTNVTTFTQTQGFCSNFVMPSNNLVVITNYITVTNGVMPASPAVIANLNYNGTNILTLSNPTYSAAGSNLVWSGLLTSNVTISAGQVISYVISNGQSGVAFHVDYDSTNKPSKIILPASTVIAINTLGVYDGPYPGGSLVTAPVAGSTLYIRASVSDPFGSYDITSLGLAITAPSPSANVSTNLNDTSVVMNDGCSKVYEFAWTTGPTTGSYAIAATANEGTEGVTASAGAGVSLIFLDLGTPSTTEFTSGNNGPATNGYPASAAGSVCVRVTDLNRNTNAATVENIVATVSSSTGDSEMLVLTETGTNTGIFTVCITTSTNGVNVPNDGTLYAPAGSVLTVNYSDPTDPTDNTSATATIKPLPGVAGVAMSKTLVSPSGGQVGVGQPVTYDLQVVNTGSTPLTNPVVTDNFPSTKLSYASATKTPTTIAAGVLTWTNLGSFTPGQSTNFTVTFTTLATGSTTNSATANGGTVTNSSSATVLITHAALNVSKILLSPTNTPVSISSNVVFRITIQNVGDTAIPTLPFEDNYSGAYYQFVSATIVPNGAGAGSLVWTNLAYPVALATNAIITNDVTMKVVGQGSPANNTAVVDYAVDIFGNPVPVSSTTTGIVTAAASIIGHVYNDVNHSGVFTNGDAGLGDVTLQLFTDPKGDGNPSDGTLVQLVATDASGYYELLNLTLGHYVVVETDLPGYASSAPANNRLALNLTTLTASTNNNFFDYLPSPASYSTISGTVWNDANGNGTNDVAETGLANVAMDLVQDVNTNGLVDAGEPVIASVTTDANGNYSFAGVTPGNYVVRENVLFGYYKTGDAQSPNDGLVAISASGGATFTNVWFLQHLNQPPLATNDFISLAENTTATIYPLGNDTDPDGNSLTITAVTTTNGAVNFANGTNVLFTPDTNFLGTLTLNYSISDGHGGSASAVIFVSVTNVPPLASPDFYSMTENTTNTFSPLLNDAVLTPGGSLAISGVNPTNGSATISETNVIFMPTLNFVGTATIGYTIIDNVGGTNQSVIIVNVTNPPPVAFGQSVATTENTAHGITLAGSDPASGVLTFIIVSGPANGTLTLINTNTGAVTYTPNANYLGTDSFTFRVNNGYNNSPAAAVNISVTNIPPLANPDSYGVGENSGTNIFSPLVNDTVLTPGGSLTIIGVSPTNGTAVISGTNVLFVSNTNFLGTATIGYTIIDNVGGTNFGLITVSVTNRPPVAVNDFASTPKNVAVTVPVLANDFDQDGNPLSLAGVSPTNGLAVISGTNVVFTPTNNFLGTAFVGYTITDGNGGTNFALITILVTNRPPVAANDSTSAPENVAVTVPVLVNDTDPDGDALTIISVSPTNGTAVIAGTNVVFTPATNFIGTAIIGYAITDGFGGTNFALVTISVTSRPPVANPDNYSVSENSTNTLSPLVNDLVVTPGGSLTIISVSPTNGSASVAGTNVIFTPTLNFVGVATIGYTITDGIGGTNSSVITVNVTNVPPTAFGQSVATTENVAKGITLTGSDPTSLPLTFILVSGPANGTLTAINTNTGAVIYTPNTNYAGTDAFAFRVNNGYNNSAVATVNILVANIPPVANPDSYTVLENSTNTFSPLTNDAVLTPGGSLSLVSVNVTNGTATISDTNVIFTPANNFTGTAAIGYTITDGIGGTNSSVITVTVLAVADVSVSKSGPANVFAATNFAYFITVTNLGPGTAASLCVTDNLPSAVSLVSATAGTTLNGGQLVWTNLGALAAGAATNLTVTVTAPLSGLNLTNFASGGSPTSDPNSTNNTSAPVVTIVTPIANLAIGKTAPANVSAASSLIYSISVTNFGPSSASSVVVTDALPAGVTFLSATGGGVNNGGVVNWNLGTLVNGQTTNVTVTVTAPASGTLTNIASVNSPTQDTNIFDNVTPPVITSVALLADLQIGKSAPASVLAAGNLTYTISVTNFGPSSAGSVMVTDTLPASVTFVSATGGGLNSAGAVAWSLGSLANGQVSNLTVTVTAPASGSLTNVANVNSPTGDPNPLNNVTPPVITSVTPLADLQIGKMAPPTVLAASNLTYTISVTNLGPSSASSVVVTDTLPAGVTFVNASGGGLNNVGVVTWSLGTLASGQTSNMTVTVKAPPNGLLTNTASVSSPTGDTNILNNVTPPVITAVMPVADVSVSKTGPAGIIFGTNFSYTISVTNFGPSTATSLSVTDNLPAGLAFASAIPATTTNAIGQVIWSSLGDLAAGTATNLMLTVISTSRGTATNFASVGSPTLDPNPTNNLTPPVVTAVTNNPPLANPDSYAVTENTSAVFNPLVNDLTQTPGGSLSLIGVAATNGVATISGTDILFTPATNFVGVATVGYTITDNVGGTNNSLVTVLVTNIPPLANLDSYVISENTTNIFNPLVNDLRLTPGGGLSLVSVSATNGTATISGTNVVFTPALNFLGTATIGYTITDGIGGTNSSLITVTVTNLPPLANPDFYAVAKNTTNTFSPLLNDVVRTPGGSLTIIGVNPTNGTASVSGTNVIFTPTLNFIGVTMIGYSITDSVGGTNIGLITVNVTNRPPVALNDFASTPKNVAVTVPVLVNDSDPDGDALAIVGVSPTNGTAGVVGTNVVFTPAANFLGTATAGYVITDGFDGTNFALITISVTNRPPVAVNDFITTAENVSVTISATANDSDPDGDALTIISVSPANGTAIITGTNIMFTPTTNFVGTATIGYVIADGFGGTNSALITVGITNRPPVANPDSYAIGENTTNTLVPLVNDLVMTPGGTLSILSVNPTNGSASISGTNVIFTPTLNFLGVATIGYTIIDNVGGTNSSVITVMVTNVPPVANPDNYGITENTTNSFSPLVNDLVLTPGGSLTILSVSPTSGIASIVGTNVIFTPTLNFLGVATIGYTITDGIGGTNSSVIFVTVTNLPPLTNPDNYAVSENSTNTLSPLVNDVLRSPGGSLAIIGVSPTNGAAIISGTNVIFTPALNFTGTATIGYTITDNVGGTNGSLITITVTNIPPLANPDNYAVSENSTDTLSPLVNDVLRTPGGSLTLIGLNPTNGIAIINGTNVIFTPTINFLGTATIGYTITDNVGGTNSSVITVLVTNLPPLANPDSYTVLENSTNTFSPLVNDVVQTPGGVLALVSVSPTNGTATISGTNVIFTPTNNFIGTATIGYVITDGIGGTNSSVITVTVQSLADVAVVKRGPGMVYAGTNFDYVITVTNLGPGVAASLSVTDSLPSAVSFVSATAGATLNGSQLVWTDLGSLAAGAATNLTVTVTAPVSGTSLTNVASGGSPTSDPNSTNNTSPPVLTAVTPVADLAIGKTAAATVFAASNLSYTIAVTNFGPSSATNVVVFWHTLPAGVTFVGASGGGVINSGVVNWNLGTLASGQISNLVLTVTAPASGTLTNVANVNSPTLDPNPTNNVTPPVVTSVTSLADVAVSKSGPAGILFGTNFSYTISVTNFGPSTATALVITDSLPAGLVFLSSVPATTTNAGNQVVWSALGDLAAGAGTNLTVTVISTVRGSVTNVASGGSPTLDPVPTNNVTPPVVTAVTNSPPLANPDGYAITENTTGIFSPLINDVVQTPGGSLTIIGVSPTNGVAVISGTSIVFTPATNFLGLATIGYTITDNVGGTNSSLITVLVTNIPPVANPDGYAMSENTTNTFSPLVNDLVLTPGGSLSLIGVAATNGTATIAGTNVVFTPALSFIGVATIGYTIIDNIGGTNSSVIIVTVTNMPPVANPDSFNVAENTTGNILSPLLNDVVLTPGGMLALVSVSPTNGTALISGTNVLFTPATNFLGTATIGYTITDGTGGASRSLITILVTNIPPVANPDTDAMTENTQRILYPLLNDLMRTPGGSLQIVSVNPTNGVVVNFGTNLIFTPTTNFVGLATIGYTITDNVGGTNSSLITITVTNIPPQANPDNYFMAENTTNAFSPLLNDVVRTPGGSLSIISVSPTNGSASINGTNVIFTPALNFLGVAMIGYTITDNIGGTNSSVITVTVTNVPPVANPDSYSMAENTTNTFSSLVNDLVQTPGGSLTIIGVSPTNGTANISGTNVIFTPALNFIGTATIGYTITDNVGGTNGSLITVTVTNVPPLANPDGYSVAENSTNSFSPLLNDVVRTPGGSLTILGVSPTNGTATINGTNVIFVPALNFVGVAAIGYTITDNVGGTNSSLITVNVTNLPPVAFGQSGTTTENTALPLVLTGSDPASHPLTFIIVTAPTNGTLTAINTNTGAITYQPNTNYFGADPFTFRVNNGYNDSPAATVNLTVTPTADLAVTQSGPASGVAGSNLVFTVTVTNLGPTSATNLMVTNRLAPGFTFVSASAGGTNGNSFVIWTIPALAASSVTNLTVTMFAGEGGTFTNLASGVSATPDLNPVNNNGSLANAQTRTVISALADVQVFKVGGTNVFAGQTVSYVITATNAGPSTATNVVVTDTLPAGAIFQSASGSYSTNSGVVTWRSVMLAPGAATTFNITLLAPPSVSSFLNIAAATSPTADPNPTNNNGSFSKSRVSTQVVPSADLVVLLSGPPSAILGSNIIYTLTVTNLGPSVASNIIVSDSLPTNLLFVSASSGGASNNLTVTWPLIASMPVGGWTNYTFTVRSLIVGQFTEIASALAVTSDPNPTNNTGVLAASQAQTTVASPQFSVLAGSPVFNPQTGLFEEQVTVTNTGTITVAGIQLYVGGLRSGVSLWNATGTNAGVPFVQYNFPLDPGGTAHFVLEFYNPSRLPFTNTLTVVAITSVNIPMSGITNSVPINKIFTDTRTSPTRFIVEWQSVPGKTYTVLYSPTLNATNWFLGTPTVTATANITQWYDDGPPKTMSVPSSVGTRFYRVIQN